MELLIAQQEPFEKASDSEDSTIHAKVLRSLQLYGPMPVEELVVKTPHFRWMDVLRAVSQLWGEGRLELEQYQGQLMILSVSGGDCAKKAGKPLRRWTESLVS
ncbi:MAG: hypothetical protein NPIRA04_11100 [Nitrospirales bacterium]|nr:MAG: hypothetical protein NPIRA04_11100 [Nitrospirales bacterium]